MTLPKITYPIHSIKLPSTKKLLNFRPYLVKEEKILLIAKESGETTDILRAIKQIVGNCCIDPKFNVKDITTTDLSYLFLQIRAFSVDNKITQTYKDMEDEKEHTFTIDLSKIEVKQDKEIDNNIKINKDVIISMKYPTTSMYDENYVDSSDLINYDIIIKCIDKIYDNNEIHDTKTYSKQELIEFVENLTIKTLESIMEFLNNAPRLEYVIEYKNEKGNERKIVLNTLSDFFTF
jgi:hypothetical protein